MAVITAEGYSFITPTGGYTSSGYGNPLSDALELGYAFDALGPPLSNATELGYTNSTQIADGNILLIWQNPLFFQKYCPTAGPTRPATGQVYPRGYS